MAMLRDRHKVQQMVDIYMFDCWLIFVILAFVLKHSKYQYFPRSLYISLRIKMANIRTTWNYGSKTNFSTSAARKIFSEFSNICPKEVAVYVHEKHSIGITSSLQTSGFVIKMFHPQNSVVNSRVRLTVIHCYSFEFWLFFHRE
jgi:hypothetical protein